MLKFSLMFMLAYAIAHSTLGLPLTKDTLSTAEEREVAYKQRLLEVVRNYYPEVTEEEFFKSLELVEAESSIYNDVIKLDLDDLDDFTGLTRQYSPYNAIAEASKGPNESETEKTVDVDNVANKDMKRRTKRGICGDNPLPSGLSEDEAYSRLGFDKNGPQEWLVGLRNIFRVGTIRGYADESKAKAQELYPDSLHNGPGDAFRHALWMYKVTKRYGADVAKQFGDAHERSSTNPLRERLMDLYNNKVGRCLAGQNSDGLSDVDVIRRAINGNPSDLQTSLDNSYSSGTVGSNGYGYNPYGRK